MVMEESVLPRRLTPCITAGKLLRSGRQGGHPLFLLNIRACGSPGDSVEHLELPVCFIPSGTQNGLTAEKTPILYAHSSLSLKKPRFSWTERKFTSLCAQADMQAETWNTAGLTSQGLTPVGSRMGCSQTGKLTLCALYPRLLFSPLVWKQDVWCSSWLTENNQPAGRPSRGRARAQKASPGLPRTRTALANTRTEGKTWESCSNPNPSVK